MAAGAPRGFSPPDLKSDAVGRQYRDKRRLEPAARAGHCLSDYPSFAVVSYSVAASA